MGRVTFLLFALVLAAGLCLPVLRDANAGWGDEPAGRTAPAPAEAAAKATKAPQAEQTKYDFQLDDLKTRSDVKMAELNDKPLVVHVWAPDCPMCKRNMPYVKGVLSKVDSEQVNFVACSMGQSNETADYVREHDLGCKVLFKGHGADFITQSFTDDGWPTSFVFAPGGELIGTCDEQGEKYQSRMLELIDEAKSKVKVNESESKPAPHKVKWWYEHGKDAAK